MELLLVPFAAWNPFYWQHDHSERFRTTKDISSDPYKGGKLSDTSFPNDSQHILLQILFHLSSLFFIGEPFRFFWPSKTVFINLLFNFFYLKNSNFLLAKKWRKPLLSHRKQKVCFRWRIREVLPVPSYSITFRIEKPKTLHTSISLSAGRSP